MLKIIRSNKFKSEIKKIKNKAYLEELKKVILTLAEETILDNKYKPHQLSGNYKGYMECHVKLDFLLIYRIDNQELYLYLYRAGSHSNLF